MVAGSSIGGHNVQIGSTSGDVVILLDRPDYRLEFLTPAPAETDQLAVRVRRQPSYLLDPQHQVVPYRPRQVEQQKIQTWLDGPEAVSVLLVTGAGGQGKTRLAGHIATECHRAACCVLSPRRQNAASGCVPVRLAHRVWPTGSRCSLWSTMSSGGGFRC